MREKLKAFCRKLLRGIAVFLGFVAAAVALPQLFALISPNIGLIAGFVIGFVGIVALFKPIPIMALDRKAMACGVLIVGFATAVVGSNKLDEQKAARLATLKQSNPTAYLAEIKKEKGDDAWRAALKEIDPKAYAVEEKRLAAEQKAAKERAEKERIAAENGEGEADRGSEGGV